MALPYLDTNFFTRTALRTLRPLPLNQALEGTRAMAEHARRFGMALTSTKTGSSDLCRYVIHETVEPGHGDICLRDVGIYEEGVASSHLDSVLQTLAGELSGIEFQPERFELTLTEREGFPLPTDFVEVGLREFMPGRTWLSPGPLFAMLGKPEVSASTTRSAEVAEVPEVPTVDVDLESLNEDRVRLLAKKYAARGFSREDEMRLEILQGRIRHLLPSVTPRDFEHPEGLADITHGINERHQLRMKRLGLES